MRPLHKRLLAASAAFFIASSAFAQGGTVTQHAFAIGKGAGVTGYSSALCTSAQLAIGQSAADPLCKSITGDVSLSAAGAITLATVNSNVGSFGSATNCITLTVNGKGLVTAASAATCTPAIGSITGLGTGVLTALGINVGSAGAFVTFNGALGTPSSATLTNATGLPIGTGVSGLGTGCATFLGTPTSANLRGCLTDEVGTGAAYFVGGALGTPASATLTNATGLPANTGLTNQVPIANGGTAQSTAAAARGSSGLNIDGATSTGDANYTILSTDRMVYHTSLTAARTDTLPAANSVNPGQVFVIDDFAGVASGTKTITLSRAGTDTINGATTVTAINAQYGAGVFWSDGSSRWTYFPASAGGGGGNVSNSGTPTAGQLASWVNATQIQGITRAQPVICDIISTSATTCNNGGSAANNGTYTTPTGALYLHVKMVGGGGGGGGSGGSGSGGVAGAGGNTCWNTSGAACTTPVYQASGGGAGSSGSSVAGAGSGGGTAGSSTCSLGISGQSGQASFGNSTLSTNPGTLGGGSAFLGGGGSTSSSGVGGAPVANTGGGGGGGGVGGSLGPAGGGGGGGGSCEFWISSPAATYTYAVGAAGTAGAAGTSGNAGSVGAAGRVTVEAFYN